MSLALTPAASAGVVGVLKNPLAHSSGRSKVIFDEGFSRKMGYSDAGRVCVSRSTRFVVGRRDRSIGIWRMLSDEQGWEKVSEMDLKVGLQVKIGANLADSKQLRSHLVALAISQDGQWLAVSDLYETKLFRLVAVVGLFSSFAST